MKAKTDTRFKELTTDELEHVRGGDFWDFLDGFADGLSGKPSRNAPKTTQSQ